MPVPIAISVNMLRFRVSSERQPRTKNGAPAHSTTGVASTSEIQFDHGDAMAEHQAEMAAHLEHEHRQGQHQRDPEPPRHVDQFGIAGLVERDLLGLQRHAADRATARSDLPHLRMHRTGVDGAGRRGGRSRAARPGIFPARLRTVRGSARRRRNSPDPGTKSDASRSPDRPSCRRRDRSPARSRRRLRARRRSIACGVGGMRVRPVRIFRLCHRAPLLINIP